MRKLAPVLDQQEDLVTISIGSAQNTPQPHTKGIAIRSLGNLGEEQRKIRTSMMIIFFICFF